MVVPGHSASLATASLPPLGPSPPPNPRVLQETLAKGKAAQSDKVRCYEPTSMKYLGFFPALTPEEVKEHVTQARKAQKIWAKSSFKQRRQFLRILLKYILEQQDLICEVSSRDTGKTMVDASLGEIMTTCEKITWLWDEGEKWLKPEYRSTGRSMLHKRAKVEFYPLGVIGAIVSWNYPFHNVFNPMLAAVFSGNAAVIKIMERASETLIPVTLELGGKDSFIVCEDVDLPNVVQIAVRAALQSSGQNCAGAERFYVHNDIYPAFASQIVNIVKSICVGGITKRMAAIEDTPGMGVFCSDRGGTLALHTLTVNKKTHRADLNNHHYSTIQRISQV